MEGRNEEEKDKKRCEVWVIGCDFRDLRRMEGELVEHVVTVLIFKLVVYVVSLSLYFVKICRVANRSPVRNWANMFKPGRRIAKMLHLL